MTLLTETAETARAAARDTTEVVLPAAAERSRHRPRRDSDRWSRWAAADQLEQGPEQVSRVA